ncbi:MAG: DUF72 domain-containing protein [Myxococcota bacterium]|nr:DUF72 domain-containing protein [Myxococcota bacterium]
MGARLRVGTSGYQYRHWRGVFYPQGLAPADWLAFYAEHFDTVEINNTFYGLPPAATFDRWREATPAGFCFALKFSRYGSHMKRLRAPRSTLRTFLGRARRLSDSLGPILVQLPPRWKADPARLEAFLAAAPGDLRFAVELRDPSWLREEVFRVLSEHDAALCIHDLLPDHPRELTAGFTYLRFHGDGYGGCYPPQALSAWAQRIRRWLRAGTDVHAYFNNDLEGHAVANALDLRRFVRRRPGARPPGRRPRA